ncbi:MAG: Ig-like domain-containing protein [Gemmataceae bacterium]
MLGSIWLKLAYRKMAAAAARARRPVLCVEGLEDRVTPAAVFAVPSAAGAPASVTVFDAATRAQKFVLSPFDGFTGGLNLAIGDVNGDGTADVIVGAAAGGGPLVNVYSGTDGSLLKTIAAGDDTSRAGASVAAADFDADGLADIVVGAVRNGQPLVQVYRFSDLRVLHGYTPFTGARGVSVAAADVTGDGVPDVIAGAGPGGGPQVVVFDGRTDAQVRSFFAFEATFTGGVGVSAGDATGDGRADILVSAGPLGGPRVSLFSGADGSVVANFFAYGEQLRNGVQATLADSDGNGTLDVVTSDGSVPKAFDARTVAQLATPPGGGLMTGASQDTVAPTVTLTTTAANPTGTSPLAFTATFSEAVNGFTAADVVVTNGTASSVVRVDSKTYTFSVTPAADGVVTVTVTAGTATDAAGNASTASAAVSRTYDATGAAVTVNALTTNDTTPTLTGTVAESTATVSVSVGGQSVAATVAGTTWSVTLPTALAEGTYTVTATATDTVGNVKSATGTLVIDTTAPTPTVTTTVADPTSTSPIPFTVTFSEDVTGFSTAGLTVTNGVVAGFTQQDAHTYTFGVAPQAQGVVSVTVTAGAATDAAGNASTASAAVTRTFDSAGPVVTANPLTTNNPTPTLTGTVDDTTATVAVVVNGQTYAATVTGAGWSAVVTEALDEGTYDVVVTATDVLGNSNTTTLTGGLVVDATAPTVTISGPSVPLTAGGPVTFTVTYADASATTVTLTDADVSLDTTGTAGGTASVSGSGLVWTVTVSGVTGDGAVGILIATGTATDAAGNVAPAAGPSATFTADNTGPDAPTVTGLDPATDTGSSDTDGVTRNPKPTFTGTAEAGSTVEVLADDGTGPVSLGTVEADATTGAWSLTGPDALADAAYTVTAVATDALGNVGAPSAVFVLVVDGSAPTATVAGAGTGGVSGTATDAGGSGVARVLVGLRESAAGGLYFDEATGDFTSNSPRFFAATDDSTGGDFSAWSYALPPGTSGDYLVTARAIDAAGNEADSLETPVQVI